MKLTFLGATDTVTGSKYLVEHAGKKYLIDCGMYQGVKNLRERNWKPLPIAAREIDAVLITHAHIDHSGYLPALMKQGFHGKIYSSAGTHELAKILLPDAGHLQEEDALFANKHKFSKHSPAMPLYTEKDARAVLKQFHSVPCNKAIELDKLHITFTPVGHILGACAITLDDGVRKIVFSGDVGRPNDAVLYPPQEIASADYLVVESTYGNRLHEDANTEAQLEKIVNETMARGGILLIPSFAVGRAQMLLLMLKNLRLQQRIPAVPIYLNSPMAISATEIYEKFHQQHKLSQQDCDEIDKVTTYVRTVEESQALTERKNPAIIISASGMASGGRVLHHLKGILPDHRNSVLMAGFQAPGTRGDAMVNGADKIKIHGEYYPMRAHIYNLASLSAHADYAEIIDWLKKMRQPPKRVFVTHGERCAADAMRVHIKEELHWNACVPDYMDSIELD
ncbi:MAG: MBL fold metallo-hydrolase [Oceanospirillaceae bacterium]|nr:MBL fold metallo-hydrolase [Oceanospirillaceae bacterium]